MFFNQKNLVHSATQSEYKTVMHWKLVLREFGINMHQIAGFNSIVADTLSRFLYTNINKDELITSRDICCVNNQFSTRAEQTIGDGYPLYLFREGVES